LAFKIIAAIVFGMLIGLDRHIADRPMALAKNIAISGFGLYFGSVCQGFVMSAGGEMAFAGEGLAGFGLFALIYHELGDGARDAAPDMPLWRAMARLNDTAPAFALGIASAFSAWTIALAFLSAKVAFNCWRLARGPQLSGRRRAPVPPGPGVDGDFESFIEPNPPRGGGVEWLAGRPPASFAAALRGAVGDAIPAYARMFPEHRQKEAAHSAARMLDARSAATSRPIEPGGEKAEHSRSRTKARDPARGRP
jgi:hypothetical protein